MNVEEIAQEMVSPTVVLFTLAIRNHGSKTLLEARRSVGSDYR